MHECALRRKGNRHARRQLFRIERWPQWVPDLRARPARSITRPWNARGMPLPTIVRGPCMPHLCIATRCHNRWSDFVNTRCASLSRSCSVLLSSFIHSFFFFQYTRKSGHQWEPEAERPNALPSTFNRAPFVSPHGRDAQQRQLPAPLNNG